MPAHPARTSQRNGREIYARFRAGLADPSCGRRHQRALETAFRQRAEATGLAPTTTLLPLFGYVVDALRAGRPADRIRPDPVRRKRLQAGRAQRQRPAGLWQFIALTARNHDVAMRTGYDGRLSPVDSTQAAVRYLKTLHGMFAGDWRLAVMAYNAGEYRVFGALDAQRPA